MVLKMTVSGANTRNRLRTLGESLAAQRLGRNLTQQDLAREAATSVSTIRRLEDGENVSIEALVRILDALKLGDRLEALAPPPGVRPMDRIRLGAERKRARARPKAQPASKWAWGDQGD